MAKKSREAEAPPEAAAIMERMVKMPPKPHEDMKLGKPKPQKKIATRTPKKPAPK